VVTTPFPFEGRRRMNVAKEGIKELAESVDSLITVPNEKLLKVMGPSAKLTDAFKESNKVLQGAVQGIAELIIRDGMINVDFADVKAVMSEMGMAMMGTGFATGENRAREAAEAAVRCPLLEDIDLQGAKGILVNITAGLDLSLGEFTEVGDIIEELASDNATVVVGTVIDPELTDELRVTVVATGLSHRGAMSKPVANNPLARHKDGTLDFGAMDIPAIVRRRQGAVTGISQQRPILPTESIGAVVQPETVDTPIDDQNELLDIPTFLRRQAD
jgi:cell division protein FtsZ